MRESLGTKLVSLDKTKWEAQTVNTLSSYSLISGLGQTQVQLCWINYPFQVSHDNHTVGHMTAMNLMCNCMASPALLVWWLRPTGTPALVPLVDRTEKARESSPYMKYIGTPFSLTTQWPRQNSSAQWQPAVDDVAKLGTWLPKRGQNSQAHPLVTYSQHSSNSPQKLG